MTICRLSSAYGDGPHRGTVSAHLQIRSDRPAGHILGSGRQGRRGSSYAAAVMPGLPSIRLCHRRLVRPCSAPHGLRQKGRAVYPAPRFQEPRRLLSYNRTRRRFVKRLGHRRQKMPATLIEAFSRAAQLGPLLLIQPCLEFIRTHGRPRNLSVHDCINEVVVSSQGGLIDEDGCIIKGPIRSNHGIARQ